MNYTQHKPQYDADGKDISGPTYEVQLVYEPNLRSHCADPTRIGVPMISIGKPGIFGLRQTGTGQKFLIGRSTD